MAGVKRKSVSEGDRGGKKFKTNFRPKAPAAGSPAKTKNWKPKQSSAAGAAGPAKSDDDGSSDFAAFSDEETETPEKGQSAPIDQDGITEKTKELYSGLSGAEAHRKQKEVRRERQAAKPNADLVQRAKKIWEKLRLKTNISKHERDTLLEELSGILKGRTKELVYKHDTVRIVQTAVKYGSPELRRQIAQELKGEYRNLAASKYAKFLIAKLIMEGDQATRDMIIDEFFGRVRKLLNHPEASWIVDDVYRQVATPKQKAVMLREWYGPDFTFFEQKDSKGLTAELAPILAETPEKRKPIMEYLHGMIDQLIQKKMTGFSMLHDAMLQYYLNIPAGSAEAENFLKLIVGDKDEEEIDLMKNLAFTKSGSRLVSLAMANGTPKDRRQLLRAFKDTVGLMATDKHGYLVLLTAFEVIDDTREIASRIFSELVDLTKSATPEGQHEKVLALADHLQGHTVLLYPFVGAAKWLLPLSAWQHISEVRKIRETTSKKDPKTRQQELIAALSAPIISTIESHAQKLATGSFGCVLIQEGLLSGVGDKAAALVAVAELAADDPNAEGHLATLAPGGKMLKALVAGGHYDHAEKKIVLTEPRLNFHNTLYGSIKPYITEWACSPSSLVVVGMMEAEGFEHREELKGTLIASKDQLRATADSANGVNGATSGDDKSEGKDKKGRGKKSGENSKGNQGSRILLGLL